MWTKITLVLTLVFTKVVAEVNSVSACHYHGTSYFCIDNEGNEGYITPAPVSTESAIPTAYSSCHQHGSDVYCMFGNDEVQYLAENDEHEDHEHESTETDYDEQHETHTHEEHEDHEHEGTETDHVESHETHAHDEHEHEDESIGSCHFSSDNYWCTDNEGKEGYVTPAPTAAETSNIPTVYSACHAHATNTFCMDGTDEVQFVVEAADQTGSQEDDEEMDCHFHAGVEHCVPKGGNNAATEKSKTCSVEQRDYDIPLRIGLIFAILATSAIGSFSPLLLKKFLNISTEGLIITGVKQFGTGIIISTAFVHLLTHAQLMFENECLTGLKYEATATSIAMAGLFVAFVIEFVCDRLIRARKNTINNSEVNNLKVDNSNNNLEKNNSAENSSSDVSQAQLGLTHLEDKVSVLLLEAGILFHSILIGITLVVAGDSYFITLFIVIVFHQFFEGLALGSRIAGLTNCNSLTKFSMALAFALITPIGMAIGIGVLNQFNGNDPSTIIAIGTLDAFSAGILIWIGIIEMWAHDWLHGPLATASAIKTFTSFVCLILGFVLMSLLGKWA